MAVWIALEGGEGSGKSTQAQRLAEALGAVLTREPGGTETGSRIRAVLLDPATVGLDAKAEALLMAADRAQHVTSVVVPALDGGRSVVSDRSAWSSLAYQGFGRGLDLGELWRLSDWAMGGRWPDLAVLIDAPPSVAGARVSARGAPDRLDGEGAEFHARVQYGFESLVAQWPSQWARVDGRGTPDEVSGRVRDVVRGRLALGL